ncbi:hypothetical protein J6590_088177 [Homalodisca vitripennis]|nr:hypothetical protein J6590_088177 [Homalodisca vitripennis]
MINVLLPNQVFSVTVTHDVLVSATHKHKEQSDHGPREAFYVPGELGEEVGFPMGMLLWAVNLAKGTLSHTHWVTDLMVKIHRGRWVLDHRGLYLRRQVIQVYIVPLEARHGLGNGTRGWRSRRVVALASKTELVIPDLMQYVGVHFGESKCPDDLTDTPPVQMNALEKVAILNKGRVRWEEESTLTAEG